MALGRMRFDALEAAEKLGGVLNEGDVFTDIMSGGRNDRPDFKGVWGLIERKEVDVVIFSRIDRLGRDAELLLKLGKLFQKTGVKAYVCAREKVIDWNSLDDWEYWSRSSIDSEHESRKISSRLKAAHKFNRYKKQAGFVAPYGYRRSRDRRYEFDPEEAPKARRSLEILEEEDGQVARSIKRIYAEVGERWTSRGFTYWLDNPVLRGHTPYGRNKHGQVPSSIEYNTHSGFDLDTQEYNPALDFRLLTEERYQRIKSAIASRKTYTGSNANKDPYPLTGLTECVCGATCTVMKSSKTTKSGKTNVNLYIRCRAGEERYRELPPHSGNARYDVIEKTVIDYLISQANLLIDSLASGVQEEELPPNPEVLNRQAQIEYIRRGIDQFGDPSGKQAESIAELQLEIAKLQKVPSDRVSSQELRDRLMKLNELKTWGKFSRRDLRRLFVSFLTKVVIDFETGETGVFLNPFLRL